jgi:hypothetical protein
MAADAHNFRPVMYDNHRHVEPSLGREDTYHMTEVRPES